MHLDQRHQIIAIECQATGTISGATVFPREVLKSVLAHQSSAVILAHGHPSGTLNPAGRTSKSQNACAMRWI